MERFVMAHEANASVPPRAASAAPAVMREAPGVPLTLAEIDGMLSLYLDAERV